jgi:hypothetical protein
MRGFHGTLEESVAGSGRRRLWAFRARGANASFPGGRPPQNLRIACAARDGTHVSVSPLHITCVIIRASVMDHRTFPVLRTRVKTTVEIPGKLAIPNDPPQERPIHQPISADFDDLWRGQQRMPSSGFGTSYLASRSRAFVTGRYSFTHIPVRFIRIYLKSLFLVHVNQCMKSNSSAMRRPRNLYTRTPLASTPPGSSSLLLYARKRAFHDKCETLNT